MQIGTCGYASAILGSQRQEMKPKVNTSLKNTIFGGG
jgi:hypothetical protein